MERLREKRDQLSSEASDAKPLDTKAIEAMAKKREDTVKVRSFTFVTKCFDGYVSELFIWESHQHLHRLTPRFTLFLSKNLTGFLFISLL